RFYSGAFRLGTGFVDCAHGRLPVPVPATVKLIEGCPAEHTGVRAELTTPTGAAVVSTLVRGEDFLPSKAMLFTSVGHGQGTRSLEDRPNLLRLFLGREQEQDEGCRAAVVMECNIDDMNPQYYDYLMDRLFQAGAYDVFMVPVQMKKNRPGVLLEVLTDELKLHDLARIVLTETTTIGLRYHDVKRVTLARRSETVETPWGGLRIKTVELPDGSTRSRPEYDDLCRAAGAAGLPVIDLARRLDAWLEKNFNV
ncbi:MAG: LarC family nickel insertion protein, partial [Gemmatimonadota bacterium]|nr:LarC family nickel insertion protein [Gemmatimonadota bacterium]